MNETTKTQVFVGGAALMVVAAVASHFTNRPRVASDFELVGQPFYEQFNSSDQAEALEVIAVDADTASMKRFKVAKEDGLYRIPSHQNYPAEAAARLASTASSLIGLERESLAGRRKNEHAKLGVIDPASEDIDDPEAVGQRVRLLDSEGEPVVDYIIGKEAGDVVLSGEDRPFQGSENQQKYYYVRRHDEDQTYKVPLKLDLSTKFSDWIDPDLLRFESADLSQINVNNYSLEELPGNNPLMPSELVKRVGDTLELSKDESDAWQLAGVDTEAETFDGAAVTEMIGVLEQLKIADVRRKTLYKGKQLLTPSLKLNRDPEFEKSPQEFGRAIQQLQAELEDKGFNLAGSSQQLQLVSENGEVDFGTVDGAHYTLHIGSPFEDVDQEIKVSGANNDETETADDEESDEPTEDESDAKSRYMMIRVEFDESLLPDKPDTPVEPTEPIAPAGYQSAPVDEAETEDTEESNSLEPDDAADAENDVSEVEESAEDTSDDAEAADEKPARNPRFENYDIMMREYEQEKIDFELAATRYETDAEDLAQRVEAGQRLVKELNERFGDWYYVIAGENLKALQVGRDQLVTAKEASPEEQAAVAAEAAKSALPTRPDISFPETDTASEPEPKADETTTKPETDEVPADSVNESTEPTETESPDTEMETEEPVQEPEEHGAPTDSDASNENVTESNDVQDSETDAAPEETEGSEPVDSAEEAIETEPSNTEPDATEPSDTEE